MVFGDICLAYSGIASLCAGRISMVPFMAAAVHAFGLHGADRHLDGEHRPNVLRLAFARAWPSLVGPRLDYAVGIWSAGSGWRSCDVSPVQTTGGNPILNRLGAITVYGL